MRRREFVKLGIAAGASLFFPLAGLASSSYEKSIHLYHTHTGESIKTTFWADGSYNFEAIDELEYFLRDFRNDEIHKIDVSLIEYLYDIKTLLAPKIPFHVISGYRSPQTNSYLRSHSRGVAKKSYHMQGKAIDIFLPGVRLNTLRYAALSLRRGGVGYYPRSGFVHIDTGKFRTWRFPKH